VALALAGWQAASAAQSVTTTVTDGTLRVQAPGFSFLEGAVLSRLRDGRSVAVELDLRILARPGGDAAARARQSFSISFDLWEERFAVSRLGAAPRSASHLTVKGAEAWCLDQLAVPLAELGRLGRDAPFWLRLEYRVAQPESSTNADADEGLTLRRLIDLFSRRRQDELRHSLEAGPFRLSN
jgi:hypothetical protein